MLSRFGPWNCGQKGSSTAVAVASVRGSMGFVGFFLLHLVQVGRAGWSNFTSMITGYERKRGERRD